MKRMNLVAAVFALLVFSSFAIGQTLQLSTGFDNTLTVQAPYPNPSLAASTQPDNYWINIATFPTTSPAVGPTWVLRSPQSGWLAPLPGSNWISARNKANSGSGTSISNPGYTIFKKCFCLERGYKKASLIFDVRADNNIDMYLNTTLNSLLAPTPGHFSGGPPLHGSTTQGFRDGRNCVYAYVEDDGGLMGFDLAGSVSAIGLLPTPAMGTDGTFAPCACSTGPINPTGDPRSAREAGTDEEQVVKEIIRIAEARRSNKKN